MTTIIETSDNSFENDVLTADMPVLVDFWAPWCGPCKAIAPLLEEIASERDDVRIAKVNVDDNNETAARYNVRAIPTLILFKGGEAVETVVGAARKPELLALLDK